MKFSFLLWIILSVLISFCNSCSCPLYEYKGLPENFDSDGTCKHCETCTETNGDSVCRCPSQSACADRVAETVGAIVAAVVISCIVVCSICYWCRHRSNGNANVKVSANGTRVTTRVTRPAQSRTTVPMQPTSPPKKVITYNPDFKPWTPKKEDTQPKEGEDVPPSYNDLESQPIAKPDENDTMATEN